MVERKAIDYAAYFREAEKKADRILERTLLAYFLFGLFLASFYDTWLIGLGVGALSLIMYFGTKFLMAEKGVHPYVGSLSMGIFMAQFIYQMHGLFEMHFTALIAIIVLIAYQNWLVFLPAALFIYLHHALFAYLQYKGFTEDIVAYQEIYFTQLDYMDFETFLFHAGLVSVAVGIASVYSYNNRKASKLLFEKIEESKQKDIVNDQNTAFAREITNGNFERELEVVEGDSLGLALLEMRKSLKISSEREKQDRFMNKGLAELSTIIRDHSNQLYDLTLRVIEFLINYMDLNQGAFFLVEEDEDEVKIEMSASYAFGRIKALKKTIEPGEGLVGQCYLEKDTLYLTEVPDEYVKIRSGLGGASPRSVIIVPVKREEKMEGVLEMASFKVLEKHEIDFLQKAAESIAVALNTAKINQKTMEMYQQSQEQTEEMRAQEEEMRQNMEELSATQEEMQRTQNDYQNMLAEAKAENKQLKEALEKVKS